MTRDHILAALRIPPQLQGVVPQNSGGFGSIRDATAVWTALELAPLQARLAVVNEWVGKKVSASSRPQGRARCEPGTAPSVSLNQAAASYSKACDEPFSA